MWAGEEAQRRILPTATPRQTLAEVAAESVEPLRLGVLLLNLGGPERGEDVEPFLYNLFRDPDIIRLPSMLRWLQRPIASVISKTRAAKSRSAYASIGGSPIARWTNAQAAALEARLGDKGVLGARSYVAMRYWHPFTNEALDEMRKDGVNALVVLPLYPQFSISTTGSSLRLLQTAFAVEAEPVAHTVVPSWHNRPGYISALAGLVAKEVAALSPKQREAGVDVLFSAHGVPKSYVEAGDPYQRQIEECAELVTRRAKALLAAECALTVANGSQNSDSSVSASAATFGYVTESSDVSASAENAASGTKELSTELSKRDKLEFHLSYQSRVGPVEWLQPYTETKIKEIGGASAGERALVVVPISFVSEHIETLEEIDMEYRVLAEEAGVRCWRRVPALGTDPTFIDDLAEMVVDALLAPSLTVSEAFSLTNCDRNEPGLFERIMSPAPAEDAVSENGAAATSNGRGVRLGNGVLAAVAGSGGGSRLATLSTVAFLADGFGREIVTKGLAHLPLHCS